MRKYYSMEKVREEANINIYGDITSYAEWYGDTAAVSLKSLSKELEELGEVSKINVYINSYGGEVAEGLAIYNALKRHKAKVVTHCDGFACSIASVIFMAGDERIMNESSLLMIHNAWTFAEGNAEQLRKQADDLEKITQASVTAYMSHSVLSEEEIKELMDNETWILPTEALEYGFATGIETVESKNANQSVKMRLIDIVKQHRQADEEDTEDEAEDNEEKPETEDETEDNEDETEDEENPKNESDDEDEKTNQKISTFFSAILKM